MDRRILEQNLASVRNRIASAARRSGRAPDAVRVVAVTKRCPSDWARALLELGVIDLGENFPQELWRKVDALADLPIHWHLIGHLQSNKVKRTLPHVRMVHGVDSLRLLRILDELAAELDEPPKVCLQVNTSGEASKHGWEPAALLADADAIAACQHIPVVGLMTMAALGTDTASARPAFARLRETRDQLRDRINRPLPELSMGMSGDFEAAIAEGATWVRVGSALFEGVES